jgi:hypothetical protein
MFNALITRKSITRESLTDQEVAELVNMSVPWVRKDRRTKRILPFYRLGRSIRYDTDTVLKAMQSRMEGGAK